MPLVSEDYLFAVLLSSMAEACLTMTEGEFNSWGREAYARALRELASASYVEIGSEDGDNITAKLTPAGQALIDRLNSAKL